LDSRVKLIFSKPPIDQISQGLQGVLGIFSLGSYGNPGSLGRSEHHQIQNALPVSHQAIFFYFDLASVSARSLDKRSGGSGVKAEFIFDHEDLGQNGFHIEGWK
jgi:hypothetical protein